VYKAQNVAKPFWLSLEHVLGQNVEDPAQVEGCEHPAHIGCCILDGLFGLMK
jgi:hypothetical protein